jgi:hypothetical protein
MEVTLKKESHTNCMAFNRLGRKNLNYVINDLFNSSDFSLNLFPTTRKAKSSESYQS